MLPEVHTMLPLATLVGKDSLKHASAKGKINMKKIINVRSIIRMAKVLHLYNRLK
jgi:hypothetical protein